MANPPSNRGNREGIAPKIRKSTPLYCTSLSPSLHFFPQIFWFFWPKKKNSTVLKGTNTAQASMRTRLLLGNKSCPATKNWFNAQNGKEYGWRRCAALRTMYVKVNTGTKDSVLSSENYCTWYFDSLSFTGGSNADMHCSHAPFTSNCQINIYKKK